MSLISLAGPALFVLAVFFALPLRAEDLHIYFKTSPRLELLRPFADPVSMSLLITGADGRPVDQGFVDIRLDAPKPGRFFSTDFPFIEGTRLNEMHLELRQGRANWSYLLPIRGEYRLAVEAVTTDGKKASQVFAFRVRENEWKWLALAGFSSALFFLGFTAGRIFTRSRTTGTAFFVGALLLGSTDVFSAQEIVKPLRTAALEIEDAKVGTPTGVKWRLKSGESARDKNIALLTLMITHLEKHKIVFGVEKLPVSDEFSMRFQFPDGAEYRIAAAANIPGVPPIRNEEVVSVSGIEPAAKAMLPALSYFLALIALGLGAGRWSRLRKVTRPPL